MRAAVVGIGSNSVRMLLADVENGNMERLRRERAGTRLFAGLDEKGNLSGESMMKTADAACRMVDSARESGAEQIFLFATSASRDAANGEDFIALLRKMTGLGLDIISGEEEAGLSFLGATDGNFSGVIDIGGGSTEIVTGEGSIVHQAMSCQMGTVRLFNLLPMQSSAQLPEVQNAALTILRNKLKEHPMAPIPSKWFGTGGTFTTLAAMIRGVHWTERTFMHGTVITPDEVGRLAIQLADLSLEERLKLPGLQPGRADIVVHGMCILMAILQEMRIEKIIVSEYGNLDGFIRRQYGIQ